MVSQNILETLKNRRKNIIIIGTDASADAPLYDCDKIYLTPISELPPSNYAECLSKIIIEESPDLILAGRDIDIIILAELKTKFPSIADRFIAGESNLAQLMEDKWLSWQFAQEESLPFAETIVYDRENNKAGVEIFVQKYGFPFIAKPRKGFASKAVSFILNYDQLSGISSDGSIIIQEYLGDSRKIIDFQESMKCGGIPLFYSLEEVKYSMQMYIGKSGELKGSVVTKHQMRNGVSAGVTIFENHGLEDLIDKYYKVFSRKGWYGPLNIQLQTCNTTNKLKAFEFNGRFTGATAARYILGYDEVGFALELLPSSHIKKDGSCGSQKNVLKQTYVSVRPDCHITTLNKHKTWEPLD